MNPFGCVSLVDKDYLNRVELYQKKTLIRIGRVDLEYLCELCDKLSAETSGEIELFYMISKMSDGSLSPLIVAKYDGDNYAALAGITDGVNYK
jgi:hypothetical protein